MGEMVHLLAEGGRFVYGIKVWRFLNMKDGELTVEFAARPAVV